MSHLLINEVPLICQPTLAIKIGLNEAIFLQQLHYWVERSTHEIQGHKWVYNTLTEWAKQFPFWSEKTIARIISSLEKRKLIISGNYNFKGFDRTKWYTINYAAVDNLENLSDGNSQKEREEELSTEKKVGDQTIWTNCPNEENQGVEGAILKEKGLNTYTEDKLSTDKKVGDHIIWTNCPNASGQLDQMHLDNLSRPIPIDYYHRVQQENINNKTTTTIYTISNKYEIDRTVIQKFLAQYGEMMLLSKLKLLEAAEKANVIDNPTGWLRCALEENYQNSREKYAKKQAQERAEKQRQRSAEQTRIKEMRQEQADMEPPLIEKDSSFYNLHRAYLAKRGGAP